MEGLLSRELREWDGIVC